MTGWTVKDRSKLIFSTSLLSGAAVCALVWTPLSGRHPDGFDRGRHGSIHTDRLGIIQELTPGHLIGRVLGSMELTP